MVILLLPHFPFCGTFIGKLLNIPLLPLRYVAIFIILFYCLYDNFLNVSSYAKTLFLFFYLYKTGAELHLAAYEALAYVLAALSTARNSQYLDLVETKQTNQARTFTLDICVTTFLNNINHLLTDGILTRSRRAVLISWKVRIIFCSASSVLHPTSIHK